MATPSTAPTLDQISRALKLLVPRGYRAMLFGSRAGGRPFRSSDWDIGILGPAPLDGARMAALRDALESIPTLHSFDLLDLATVPDEFRERALKTAVPVNECTAALASLESALARLQSSLAQQKTEWTRDAAIQRFEFTFDLAFKAAHRLAKHEGLDVGTPREAFKTAMKLGWIDDDPVWLRMLEDRNRTSHTYNETTAEEIYARLPAYVGVIVELAHRLKKRLE